MNVRDKDKKPKGQRKKKKEKIEKDHQVIQNLMTINMGIKITSAIRYKKTLEKRFFFTKN